MNIEHLSRDQLSRLQDIHDCVDVALQGIVGDIEILELLRIRLCFDLWETEGLEADPERAFDSPLGVVALLGFEAPSEMNFCHEAELVTC